MYKKVILAICLNVAFFISSITAKSLSPDKRLILAANVGNFSAVNSALNDGADPNVFNQAIDVVVEGVSPLMAACYSPEPNAKMIDFLVAHGAKVNLQNDHGHTALMICSSRGITELVKKLLDYGADAEIQDNEGWTAVRRAAEAAQFKVVKLLVGDKLTPDLISSMLIGSITEGSETKTALMIQKGADVNVTDHGGDTALAIASFQCKDSIAHLLIEGGARLDVATTTYRSTPLHVATEQNCISVMKLLLDVGADPNAREEFNGETPLFLASRYGYANAVRLLLFKGADPNVRSVKNKTPFSEARNNECKALLKKAISKKQ